MELKAIKTNQHNEPEKVEAFNSLVDRVSKLEESNTRIENDLRLVLDKLDNQPSSNDHEILKLKIEANNRVLLALISGGIAAIPILHSVIEHFLK